MISPTLSRIEMDKYLISREKSCQAPERKKERKKLWAAVIVLPCLLPPACHWYLQYWFLARIGLAVVRGSDSPISFSAKTLNSYSFPSSAIARFKLWFFKIGPIFYTFLDRWQWNLCWMWQPAWTRHQRRHRISQWDILEGGHQSPWISPRRVYIQWQ